MPAKLNRGDRKILLIAGGVFLALVAGALLFTSGKDESDFPSSYSTASQGAKAAYLLLQESGYHVDRWLHPPQNLGDGTDTVLILAEPARFPTQREKAGLEKFLDSGGKIIAIGTSGAMSLPEESIDYDPIDISVLQKYPALTPSKIARAAPEITLDTRVYWKEDPSATALYGKDDKSVVIRYPHGKGEVIWWAAATPISNAGIRESGNLEFFLACLGEKQSTRILWDEYFHGFGEQSSEGKTHWLAIVTVIQFGVIGLAVVFTFSRRSGPLRPMAVQSRLSPLEFVDTLGGLYRHAKASSVAVDVYYQRFHYWLTRRLGMANDASVEELARAVRDRWNFKDEQFAPTLQVAASARYRPDLRAKDALRLVQSLHSYAVKLKLFPASTKEKF
jgi:hypothetical protein